MEWFIQTKIRYECDLNYLVTAKIVWRVPKDHNSFTFHFSAYLNNPVKSIHWFNSLGEIG